VTDYNAGTGNAGTLIISDNGSRVELVVKCTDGATNAASVTFDTTMNGVRQLIAVSLPRGFGQKVVRAETVSTTQTVTFNMPATGTSGLGGPTNHSAVIPRDPPPPQVGPPVSAPVADRVHTIKSTSALLEFAWRGGSNDGGSPILYFHTNWALSPTEPIGVGSTTSVGQPSTMSPLVPGSHYWCSVRAVNAYGAGPWSNALEFDTLTGAYVSNGTAWVASPVYVDDAGTFKIAEVFISDGIAWKVAG